MVGILPFDPNTAPSVMDSADPLHFPVEATAKGLVPYSALES